MLIKVYKTTRFNIKNIELQMMSSKIIAQEEGKE